jgi:hypothetical protein
MDNNTLEQIKDTLAKGKSIGVAAPKNPSLDEMAAALAFFLVLKNSDKNVSIASPTDPLVEVSSLVGIDKVQKRFSGSGSGEGDLTVSFPYTEGEIEKVSYTLEEGHLNIIVKASGQGLSFDEKDVQFARGGSSGPDAVFAIGVARISDLDPLFDTQNPDIRIINIDNKAENEQYGDINLVSSKISSVSEGVTDLMLGLGLHIDEDAAQNLLNGISDATKNFQNPKTSSLAFEMAALLLKKGATREVSEAARRGITVGDRAPQQPQVRQQPQQARPVSQKDQAKGDRASFEEHLKRRVAEEKERERNKRSSQPGQKNDINQASTAPQQDAGDYVDADLPTEEEAPNDWLAPKVYKGSSEV